MRAAKNKIWLEEAHQWQESDKQEAERAKKPYIFRFYFDADECLWAGNNKTFEDFSGSPISPNNLPISDHLKQEARELMKLWNWGNRIDIPIHLADNPEEIKAFYRMAHLFFARLRQELGPEFILLNHLPYFKDT